MLDKELIDEIEAKLLAEKKRLLDEAVKTLSGLHAHKDSQPDFSDRSSTDMDQDVTLNIREREQRFIEKIDSTLKKIRTDDFGKCEGCGCSIGIRRLMARPTVRLCIECKTEEERNEKVVE